MAFFALKSGEWEEYKHTFRNEVKVTEWAFDRIKEAFEKVAKDEARKLSTVQEIMIRSTDYLQRIIAPAGGQGGVTMSYLCQHRNSFPMEDYVWWVSAVRKAYKLVVRDLWRKIRLWKQPNRLLVVQTRESVNQTRSSERMQAKVCWNLINALKLLSNQQEDGDGLIQNIVTNLRLAGRAARRC